MSSVLSASPMRCPDCNMGFRDAKLLAKHRQKFCPGLTREPSSGGNPTGKAENSLEGSLRQDLLRLEQRVAEALSNKNNNNNLKQSSDEDNFWKARQKQAEELDQIHQIRLAELRERDRRLTDERNRIQGHSGSLGMLAMIQAMKPRTPPPQPPPVPPPTIIPSGQPFIVPPNHPPLPQAPVLIEPPPAQPPQIITIASGDGSAKYPPLPPPPPIIQPPVGMAPAGPSMDPTHLLLLQQIRDTDASHQASMRDLQILLRQIEENARKDTPPPIIVPSPQPPILLPRPEPPVIINPPEVRPPPTVITMPPPPPAPRPYTYIGGAGSIIGEVQNLRQAYQSNGGIDGDMIFALAQLEREAREIGELHEKPKKRHRRRSSKPKSANIKLENTLRSIEIENDRLTREINLLHQQSTQANMTSRASEELERRHSEYVRKISQLEREVNNKRLEINHGDDRNRLASLTLTDDFKREVTQPPPVQYAPAGCPHGPNCAHCTGGGNGDNILYADQKIVPAPSFRPVVGPTIDFPPLYPDQTETPTAGMYVFWDFMIGLPPETTAVRLHAALYNDTYALGRPTSLPVFYTQQLPESSFFPYNMRIAMMSMMQQIPGCEPSSDLCIIAEVHLSIASGPLNSKAWVKIDIFDEKLRVKSGRWRVALRCVPVETALSSTEVHNLNQYHRGELFFRIATHAQAQVEAKQKMNPNYANYYNYLKPTIHLSAGSPRH